MLGINLNNYIGKTIQIATLYDYGDISDHIHIEPNNGIAFQLAVKYPAPLLGLHRLDWLVRLLYKREFSELLYDIDLYKGFMPGELLDRHEVEKNPELLVENARGVSIDTNPERIFEKKTLQRAKELAVGHGKEKNLPVYLMEEPVQFYMSEGRIGKRPGKWKRKKISTRLEIIWHPEGWKPKYA